MERFRSHWLQVLYVEFPWLIRDQYYFHDAWIWYTGLGSAGNYFFFAKIQKRSLIAFLQKHSRKNLISSDEDGLWFSTLSIFFVANFKSPSSTLRIVHWFEMRYAVGRGKVNQFSPLDWYNSYILTYIHIELFLTVNLTDPIDTTHSVCTLNIVSYIVDGISYFLNDSEVNRTSLWCSSIFIAYSISRMEMNNDAKHSVSLFLRVCISYFWHCYTNICVALELSM